MSMYRICTGSHNPFHDLHAGRQVRGPFFLVEPETFVRLDQLLHYHALCIEYDQDTSIASMLRGLVSRSLPVTE